MVGRQLKQPYIDHYIDLHSSYESESIHFNFKFGIIKNENKDDDRSLYTLEWS